MGDLQRCPALQRVAPTLPLLQAVATSAGRLSPTMDDYRAFAWASAGHKDRNVTDHLAAFLAPRLARTTLRLWRRGIAASPVAVFDFEETYAVARLTAALGTEVDTRHGRASFLQQSDRKSVV